ncbi:MAG: TrmH family RNA methyltransferase, partial [archaeon]
HLGLASNTKIEFTGSSLTPNHSKVIAIINSWLPEFKETTRLKHVSQHPDFEKRILQLKKQGYEIIGTSSHEGSNLFSANLSKGKKVIVFGTETSGLSLGKMHLMNKMLLVPMKNDTKFFTLRTVAPIFTYETLRQKKLI